MASASHFRCSWGFRNSFQSIIYLSPYIRIIHSSSSSKPVEKKAMKGNQLATLEERVLALPGRKLAESISSGELHVFKHPSKNKAHRLSSNRVHAELITPSPRESLIPLKRTHEEDHGARGRQSLEAGSSVGRSQSGQQRKKVCFRRPEADVVIFYSPEDEHCPSVLEHN